MAGNNKRIKKFSKKMQIKLMAIFAFVLCLLVILNVRIAYITAKSGDQYARKVLSQQQYDSRTIPFRRGEILDRNGSIIAKSEKVYNVVVDCFAINQNLEDYKEPTIRALVSTLGVDEAEVSRRIDSEETKDSQYQVIKRQVTLDEKQKFDEYTDLSADRNISADKRKELENVQGVWFEENFVRQYPLGSLASNVVGFSNSLNDGMIGLESYYTEVLNGVDGREFGYLNENAELQRTTIEPTNGNSIVSTIDVNVQQVIEKYIKIYSEEHKNGPQEDTPGRASKNTAVIVGDPNTGEILGMATDKSFDLNDPQNLTDWYTQKEIDEFDEEEMAVKLNEMWTNYCISGAFELGSTYKPIVVASALETGDTSDSATFNCGGYLQIADRKINCDNVLGHGPETLSDVVKNSCNVGMMHIVENMGIETFSKYQSLFNFGKRTGIDLPNEGSGLMYNSTNMKEVDMATSSFGQTFTATMLQEYAAFSTVVNGGHYYKPHLVKQVLDSKGGVAKNIEPLLLSEPISSKNSALLREYLEQVVEDGTGTKAQIPGYRIGGKTGTAEKLPRDNGKYVVSFIGAVPIDNPKVVIYAVIDEPNVEDQEFGGYTIEMTQGILSEILPYLGVYPTEEITDEQKAKIGMQSGDGVAGDNSDGTQGFIDEDGDGIQDEPTDGSAYGSDGVIDGVPDNQNYNPPPEDTGEEQLPDDDGITNEDLQIGQ